jgi:toxin YoeB
MASRSPFEGIGKPEPLKGDLSGHWSRRITDEHRLIYTVTPNELIVIACRFHYK